MTMLLEQPELLQQMMPRLYPHTFAEWASDGEWVAAPHLRYISVRIAHAVAKGRGRVMVWMPPGHGKSKLISKWTPTWFLENMPKKRVIMTSYGADLAEGFGREVRDEFQTNPKLLTKLKEDSKSVSRWHTQEGGEMTAGGVGGPLIGRRGDLLIIDDPIKNWEDAYSPVKRRKAVEWFNSTFYTRKEPRATIIILLHRWHPDDLAGYILKNHSDPWEVIRLPALAEEGDPLGRQPGDALWPERFDKDELNLTIKAVGKQVADAMYQQNPTAVSTGRVYDRYTQAGNLKACELRDDLDLHLSIDFNVNPGMHMIIGQYDARADIFTSRHEIHGPRMKTPAAIAAFIKLVEQYGGFRWPRLVLFGDRSGRNETTLTTDTDYALISRVLKENNIPFSINVPKANPPIKRRVDSFNDALSDTEGLVHYHVHPECVRLVTDLESLMPGEDGLIDKTDQTLSHASDADGYRIMRIRPITTEYDMGPTGAIIHKGASQ